MLIRFFFSFCFGFDCNGFFFRVRNRHLFILYGKNKTEKKKVLTHYEDDVNKGDEKKNEQTQDN